MMAPGRRRGSAPWWSTLSLKTLLNVDEVARQRSSCVAEIRDRADLPNDRRRNPKKFVRQLDDRFITERAFSWLNSAMNIQFGSARGDRGEIVTFVRRWFIEEIRLKVCFCAVRFEIYYRNSKFWACLMRGKAKVALHSWNCTLIQQAPLQKPVPNSAQVPLASLTQNLKPANLHCGRQVPINTKKIAQL